MGLPRALLLVPFLLASIFFTGAASAEPTRVFIGFHFIAVRSVDLRAQTFFADFYMWERFATGDDEERDKAVAEKLEFMNGKPDVSMTDEWNEDGTHYVCWRVQGTFNFGAHLENYPFDTQSFSVVVENSELEVDRMVFVDDSESYARSRRPEELRAVRDDVSIPEFHLRRVTIETVSSHYDTDFGDTHQAVLGGGQTYSRQVATLSFQRNYWPYVFKIIVPLAIIVAMSYLVFFIPPEEVGTASSIAITALLSCIAFNVTVAQNLPDVGYLVVSDKFFITSYALVFLTLVETVATHRLAAHDKHAQAKKLDLWGRWGFPFLYVGMFAYLIVVAARV